MMLGALFERVDETRRQCGIFLERLGFGPHTTPSRTARVLRAARLLAYQPPSARRPAILMVPAPIKTAYIWDLAPDSSPVRRCVAAGFQVYLVVWLRPRPADQSLGLAHYADGVILDCVDAVRMETGQEQVFLAGHSLGGTLAAIFSSRHPERVRGLIELEGPIAFGAGRLELAAAIGRPAEATARALGNVPGSALNWTSTWADPYTYQFEPLFDSIQSCYSPAARDLHLRLRRWSLDESPMARRLFYEVMDRLYRENRFVKGTLEVSGQLADPQAIVMPVLGIVDPRSRIVPREAIEAYRTYTRSEDLQILEYPGDQGVVMQHLGVLVGRNAHDFVWPQILRWMERRAGGGHPPSHSCR